MKIFNLHHIAQSLKFLFNMWNIHSSLWWILISRRQRRLGKRRCWNKIFIHRGITRHRIVWIPSSFKPDRIGWKGDSCWIPGHVQKAYSRQDWIKLLFENTKYIFRMYLWTAVCLLEYKRLNNEFCSKLYYFFCRLNY